MRCWLCDRERGGTDLTGRQWETRLILAIAGAVFLGVLVGRAAEPVVSVVTSLIMGWLRL